MCVCVCVQKFSDPALPLGVDEAKNYSIIGFRDPSSFSEASFCNKFYNQKQ